MLAVVYIPGFCLQAALRHRPELLAKPVAILDESLPKPMIVEATGIARAHGVTAGLTSTQAMARCREIIIVTRSPVQEAAAHEAILQCCFLFSPYVEATAPGTFTLDLKGQSDGGNEVFGKKLLAVLEQLGLKAQVGVATTPRVALYAAHSALPFLRVGDANDFLNKLPLETLNPRPQLLDILHRWGIRTLGEFIALGKNALAERLGAEALQLLEHASCEENRPLHLTQPREVFEESFEFETEIESLEPLLFLLRRFVEQLSLRLALSSFAAQELVLRLTLEEGSVYERNFKIPAPTTAHDVLFRVLYTHLENLTTEHPVKALYLGAKPCRPAHEQFNLFDCILRDPNSFYETTGRLTALVGAERVGVPALLPVHRPDAFEMQPVDFNAPAEHSAKRSSQDVLGLALRRFRPAVTARVELREDRPCALWSALIEGVIRRAEGPWRTSGQWWDKQRWERDEWDIQMHSGTLYRVYQQAGEWFVEGMYD